MTATTKTARLLDDWTSETLDRIARPMARLQVDRIDLYFNSTGNTPRGVTYWSATGGTAQSKGPADITQFSPTGTRWVELKRTADGWRVSGVFGADGSLGLGRKNPLGAAAVDRVAREMGRIVARLVIADAQDAIGHVRDAGYDYDTGRQKEHPVEVVAEWESYQREAAIIADAEEYLASL